MILLNGIDLVDNSKIKKMVEKHPLNLQDIFTEHEIAYCISKPFPYQSFGSRFAAKEAVIKAVDADIWDFDLKDIEVIKTDSGKPEILIGSEALNNRIFVLLQKNNYSIALSLSHEKGYSIAQVIIY